MKNEFDRTSKRCWDYGFSHLSSLPGSLLLSACPRSAHVPDSELGVASRFLTSRQGHSHAGCFFMQSTRPAAAGRSGRTGSSTRTLPGRRSGPHPTPDSPVLPAPNVMVDITHASCLIWYKTAKNAGKKVIFSVADVVSVVFHYK